MLEISSSSLKQLRIIFAVTVFYFLFLIRSWYFIAGIAFIAAISAVSYNFLILNGKGGSIFLDQERIIESFGLVMITTSIFYAGTIFLNSKNSSIPKRIAITKCSIPSY